MTSLAWGFTFGTTFYGADAGGVADPSIAPHRYPVGVGGRGFLVDTKSERFLRGFEDPYRPQTDDSTRPGEKSLSNTKQWRRGWRSWHHGAGQSLLDLEDNDPYRYDVSKGIDPWTEGQVKLLQGTELERDKSGATFLRCLVADGKLAVVADTDVDWTANLATWTDAGTLDANPLAVTTDGTDLYVACDDDNVKIVTLASWSSTDEWILADVDVLGFVKGRLIAGAGDKLYNLVPGVAVSGEEFDADFDGWRWDAISEGPNAIYVAGHLGDKSAIYRWGIEDDGTLGTPIVAAPLPDGELVRSLASYLGYLIVGTTKGVRFAALSAQGDVTLGAVIPTENPVWCFEPQDRFVWFGWTNYDDDSTGLGRLDLSQFTNTLTPAYASDLMYTGQGVIRSVVTFRNRRVFAVQGAGIVKEDLVYTAGVGTIDLSSTDFELVEDKIALFLELAHDPLEGAVEAWLERNSAGFESVGTSSDPGSTGKKIELQQQSASVFTIRLTLTPEADVTSPIVTSVLFRVRPQVGLALTFQIPLLIEERYEDPAEDRNCAEDVAYLEALVEAQAPMNFQMGTTAYTVLPDSGQFLIRNQTEDKTAWRGTYLLQMSEVK